MFSVVSVCPLGGEGGGFRVTITFDALDLTQQDMFNLVHYEACMVGKWVGCLASYWNAFLLQEHREGPSFSWVIIRLFAM